MSEEKDSNEKLKNIFSVAVQYAKSKGHAFVTTEHLLAAIMADDDVQKVMIRSSGKSDIVTEISKELVSYLDTTTDIPKIQDIRDELIITDAVTHSLDRATARIKASGGAVNFIDLLISVAGEEDTWAQYYLVNGQINDAKIIEAARYFGMTGFGANDANPNDSDDVKTLREYCVLLNEKAINGKIDPLIGRTKEVQDIIETLARRNKNNVVITGAAGCGKTQLVEGLAKLIVEKKVPHIIADADVWSLDIGLLMAGTRYRGDVEERVTNILKALENQNNPILFIDEIHLIMGSGKSSEGGADVANLLKPALARGDLKVIGSTTIDEFKLTFEKDKALMRRFQKIVCDEPSIDEAIKILKGVKKNYEQFHRVSYSGEAIAAAVKLSVRYIQTNVLPDKAFDVIDKAGAKYKLDNTDPDRKIKIGVKEIEDIVSEMARVPVATVRESEISKLSHLRENIEKVVFDQEYAVDTLVKAVIRARSGLVPQDKTLGSFLLCGASGVGKTELSKALADTMDMNLVKLDMSEYSEAHSISKLIGAPPGYVGFDDPKVGDGKLINEIETHPYSVLLLDEIEKAHPSIYNILLQVMDDGKLTASSGKTVSFRNVFLLMTSNAGAADASRNAIGWEFENVGFDPSKMDKAIENKFTPEFRNRLDAIVKFKQLSRNTMLKVVDKFIGNLNDLTKEKNIVVEVTDTAKEWLAEKGYDPKMGARPLNRVIAEFIKDPLAELMVFGDLKKGGTALVDVTDDGLSVTAK